VKRMAMFAMMVAFLLLASVALAQGTPTINWSVIGGGGGHAEAAPYALDGTLGQPIVGLATGPSVSLCAGYWCGAAAQYRVYLPLVLRNF